MDWKSPFTKVEPGSGIKLETVITFSKILLWPVETDDKTPWSLIYRLVPILIPPNFVGDAISRVNYIQVSPNGPSVPV